jgi:pre-mRNA-splicing factor SPF27
MPRFVHLQMTKKSKTEDVAVLSLPYIDDEYNEIKDLVDDLVKAEMKEFKNCHSFNDEETEVFESNPTLKAEMDRTAEGVKLKAIDLTRYKIEQEKAAPSSVKDCEDYLGKQGIQHQHLALRLLNLELLERFGEGVWDRSIEELQSLISHFRKKTDENNALIVEINRKRKLDQLDAGKELTRMEHKWINSIQTRLALEIENAE